MNPRRAALALAAAAAGLAAGCSKPGGTIVVGSKSFTESVLLGEMAAALARATGVPVEHRRQLGGTEVLFRALESGEIDVYPEYTGTLTREILRREMPGRALEDVLRDHGMRLAGPLGFANNYALAMTEARAAELNVQSISDLVPHREVRVVLSNELLRRGDGWPGLAERYGLRVAPRGMDHDLAIRAVASGAADVTDVYTTDADIQAYGLRVLRDDRAYFDRYDAVLLYRADLEQRAPAVVAALKSLAGKLDAPTMIALNASVRIGHTPEPDVAARFLARINAAATAGPADSRWRGLARNAGEHALLVALSLLAAIAVAVPLGIVAARRPRLGHLVLGTAGLLQTIPSLALLVLLIPLFGIGTLPALVALFLYGLLPIVRNTHAGLVGIPAPLRDSARALGLPRRARLRLVELPLALPSIVAGIKTSAVISVGTATIGALVGAGGFGQPILTGIRLNDFDLILQGAIPAAVMAIALERLFDALERHVVPRAPRRPPGN